MRSINGREFAKLLEKNGWTLLRTHGSHHVYGRPGDTVRLSVPIHEGRDLKIGLLRHLLKLAGLSEADL